MRNFGGLQLRSGQQGSGLGGGGWRWGDPWGIAVDTTPHGCDRVRCTSEKVKTTRKHYSGWLVRVRFSLPVRFPGGKHFQHSDSKPTFGVQNWRRGLRKAAMVWFVHPPRYL